MRLSHLTRDLRHAWRSITRMPMVATVVVVSLAMGIGVNTTVFSWLQLVVLQPLPGVARAGALSTVEAKSETGTYPGVSWPEYRDLRERMTSFKDLLAFRMAPFNVGESGRTERSFGLFVSGNYFAALGLSPAAGRFFRPEEGERPGSEPVVVLSYRYWQSHFGGAADAVGRTLRVNGNDLAIVGVSPRNFQGTVLGLDFDLWIPATMAPVLVPGSRELEQRDSRGYAVAGWIKPGASRAQAQGEAEAAMRQLAALYPASNRGVTGEVLSFWQAPHGPQRMLARASSRQREIGARLALGAGRRHIVSLLLTENLLLALLGAGFGALIAVWGTNALRAVPFIGTFPIRFQTHIDLVGLSFAMGLGVLCGLLFGVAPAGKLSNVDPQLALRSGYGSALKGRSRGTLMGVEVGLALVVLVVAAMFFKNFSETRDVDPGFKQAGLLLAGYDLSARNPEDSTTRRFTAQLLARLRAIPGVEGAAISSSVPLDIHGLPLRSFRLEGRARPDDSPDRALSNVVSPGYFATMGIQMLSGADFADLTDAAAPPQAIVNDEFVTRYLNGAEALGRKVRAQQTDYVIVGVVKSSLYDAFGEPPTPIIYYSYRDRPYDNGQMHIRTRPGAETALAAPVERALRELDASLPIYDVRTMTEHIDKNLFLRKIPARMFAVLGPLLLVLAGIGIYAVVAYSVAQRTHEIGLRLALGAARGRVVRQIMGESLGVVGWGIAGGLFLSVLFAMHAAKGVINLTIFAGVPLVLLMVAALASWLPARRAARVDPMVALRSE